MRVKIDARQSFLYIVLVNMSTWSTFLPNRYRYTPKRSMDRDVKFFVSKWIQRCVFLRFVVTKELALKKAS